MTPFFAVDLRWVGQNMASRGNSAGVEAPTTAIPNMINSWFDQHRFTPQTQIDRLTSLTGTGG